ncbi:trans-sulfuration enzyme family protein [Aeromicrobium duanguangcaii]|uniref:PLP-dependent aspartate aminotransferase family protein n=1 Tax=Aeromicrobium duanguangcaii TaxID=2968086 RepID=A0ABY5KI32_9ACTN|nr:PLP-dependent aspartate aminotransferase family protein [Aeromicrobium duanguangcaii]MCD9153414.1 PLP-dependent aspartate aminotransferase family protein [Aeromicrobium duanguangcaii]UUI69495.1 PLP-dependent aspartate aminotransferase family protein [Aeromicrobium duanguangcaii]
MQPDTVTVIAGRPAKQPGAPLNAPITLASSFHAGGDFEYGRHGNPAYESFEQVVGELEGGRALAFASGIATAAATLGLVEPGAVVVLPRHGYNGTTSLVQSGPYEVRLIDPSDTEGSIAAFAGADLVWLESPTNPAMEVGDLPTLVSAAKDAGALVAVDNTFRTPLRDRPLSYGADIVAHSASKLLGGHSDLVLGVMATADDALFERLLQHRSLHGAIPGALESFLAARGVRTLAVRLDRAESSAAVLADRLKAHPAVSEVRYPGFGTMVCFVIDDPEHAQRTTESSRVITHATSLGGVESTWERRRRFPAEPETIPAGLIRLSVGIEAVEDLWADIEAALG